MDQCGHHPSSAEEQINVKEVELKPLGLALETKSALSLLFLQASLYTFRHW